MFLPHCGLVMLCWYVGLLEANSSWESCIWIILKHLIPFIDFSKGTYTLAISIIILKWLGKLLASQITYFFQNWTSLLRHQREEWPSSNKLQAYEKHITNPSMCHSNSSPFQQILTGLVALILCRRVFAILVMLNFVCFKIGSFPRSSKCGIQNWMMWLFLIVRLNISTI